MRLAAVAVILICFFAPTRAEEPTLESNVDRKLLEIELASCLEAYEQVSTEIRNAELEMAVAGSDEMKSRFGEHLQKLRVHRNEIRTRANDAATRIQEHDGRRVQKQKPQTDSKCCCGQCVNRIAIERTASRQAIFELYLRDRPRRTGRDLDVAIEGHGYLQVLDQTTNGVAFTRIGNLDIDEDGYLMVGPVQNRLLLSPSFQIPKNATSVIISNHGAVRVLIPGEVELKPIGQIKLARFANPRGLVESDENLYSASEASGPPEYSIPGEDGVGVLRQGSIEVSDQARTRELVDALLNLLTKNQ